jgi:phosphoglycerate dehydrogenase-like enzyme
LKVLIPDSVSLKMPSQSQGIEYVTYSVSQSNFNGHQDAELLVLWMNTPENIAACVGQLKSLKLVQTLAAGPDQALGAGFADQIAIASGRGLHDKPVAEHALALTLASIRNLDGMFSSQQSHYWNQEILQAQAAPQSSHLYTLNGSSILIIGFGSIALHLAPMLGALGAEVSGIAQSSGNRNGYPVSDFDSLEQSLAAADVVISLLPFSQETENIFGRNFFNKMKDSAIFINVGRGKTVDESSLIDALKNKLIRRAAIDVTHIEPLPSDSPLWDCPNLIITPHISGGRPQEPEKLIARNAHAVLTGTQIFNLVNR